MALSAKRTDEAHETIRKAWRLLLTECQECGDRFIRDDIHRILSELERIDVKLIRLMVQECGFDYWKAIQQEEAEAKRKKLANKHCSQLGLEIPYPEITE